MKQFFLKLFTWWNSQTFGTQLWTGVSANWSEKIARVTAITGRRREDRSDAWL